MARFRRAAPLGLLLTIATLTAAACVWATPRTFGSQTLVATEITCDEAMPSAAIHIAQPITASPRAPRFVPLALELVAVVILAFGGRGFRDCDTRR
jgi:hypothetical protein